MIYNVRHISRVTYGAPVELARFNIRLKPIAWPGQTLLGYGMTITPQPAQLVESAGPYLVNTSLIALEMPLSELVATSEFRVEVLGPPTVVDSGTSVAQLRRQALDSRDLGNLAPGAYLFASRIVALEAEIGAWAARFLADHAPILPAIRALASEIHANFTYQPGVTGSHTRPLDAFHARHGVCQDFAQIMIAALRMHGVPAAYISGYLRTEPPPGQPRLIGADAMHAWVNVWCGSKMGWIAVDPTNDQLADDGYVVVAMGRDYADVAPVDGVFVGSSAQRMQVAVDVIPQDG